MSLWTFFYKAFGILLLMAAACALIGYNGSAIYTEPLWLLPAPFLIFLVFTFLGVKLLKISTYPTNGKKLSNLDVHLVLGLTALVGCVLTYFFHGDTAADKEGVQRLRWMVLELLILYPCFISALKLVRRQKTEAHLAGQQLSIVKI